MPKGFEFVKNPLEGRTVRVSIPASIANDGDRFKNSIADLMAKLGCKPCFSGADCHFSIISDWVINEKGAATFFSRSKQDGDPDPEPNFSDSKAAAISVRLAPKVSRDIASVFKAIDVLGKNLGCAPCHSGYDISFLNAIRTIRLNEKFEVDAIGNVVG